MKHWAIVFASVFLGLGLSAQRQTGVVEGTVLRAATGEPLANVQVALIRVLATPSTGGAPTLPPAASATTSSNEKGQFVFGTVEPGNYRIAASLKGYATQEYGVSAADTAGTILNVAVGATVRGVDLSLTPLGAVTGRILGDRRRPLRDIEVILYRYDYDATGNRTLEVAGNTRTNDRGDYRIYWIPAGRYLVGAGGMISSGALSGTPSAGTAFASTFYPGVPNSSAASSVQVRAGVDTAGIDLDLLPGRWRRVSGRVVGVDGKDRVRVSLISRDLRSSIAPALAPNGTFEFAAVQAGVYWLHAELAGEPFGDTRQTPSPRAIMPIEVEDEDIRDLALTPSPAVTVSGRIVVESGLGSGSAPPAGLRVSIRLPNGLGERVPGPVGARVEENGAFTVNNVTRSDNLWSLSGLPGEYYIKEAKFGAVDVLGKSLDASTARRDQLSIVISARAGRVTGTVAGDNGRPVAGGRVVLVPEIQRERSDLYRAASTDANGRFALTGIAPGTYKLFAWDALPGPYSYFDRDFIRASEGKSRLLRVDESSNAVVDLVTLHAEVAP